jgi:hypothetical protein
MTACLLFQLFVYIYFHIKLLNLIKKTISICLIVLLGFNAFGLSFFYLAAIQLCKIKAETYADNDHAVEGKKLILFSSATKGVELVDKNEIRVDGKMYDVVKKRISKGIIMYYTLGDNDEDSYIHQLTGLEKNNPVEKSLPGKTIKLYEAKYFAAKKHHHTICLSIRQLRDVKTANDPFLYTSIFKDVFSPPPNRSLS